MTYEIDAKRGVANHYGVRTTDSAKGAQSQSVGQVKQAVWTWTWDNLPAAGASNLEYTLPNGASVVSAKLIADEAWDAVLDVGTAASPVGLWNDADLSTEGDVLTSAGALVGAALAAESEIVVTSAATAGKATLVVEYVYAK